MAFTVGWLGLSLVSVDDADQHFADRGVTAWPAAGKQVPDKQAALVRATDYVRAMFFARLDPALVNPDLIPDALVQAISQYALIELKTPGGLAPTPQVDAAGVGLVLTRKKIGPIEKQYSVVGGTDAKPATRRSFPVADALIASLLLSGAGLARVIR